MKGESTLDASTLAEVMGNVAGVDYAALAPGYENALRAADVTTPQRAAMWAAQLGHESVGLRYMREIASGAEYEGRGDLGNIYPGDGVRFAGRGPIQLTGRANYRAFTAWARTAGHAQIDFEAEPQRLEDPRWGFLAAAWYWTQARPQINAMCDAGDLEGVTRAINGGLNGLADRRARYAQALAMGDRLLPGGSISTEPVELVLDYPRDQVVQDTGYFCGPASSQTVIRAATGKLILEKDLAVELKTTVNGTDCIGQFPAVLNAHIPGAGYTYRDMPNDPPTAQQREQLWEDICHSIRAGYGVIANIVAPPGNYPRAVAPSTIPFAYSGGTVYHYIAVMGIRPRDRTVWIADSGFYPYGGWITLDQLASLIPPKGYAFSTAEIKEEFTMADIQELKDYIDLRLTGPVGSDVKDIRQQLTGGRDAGEYPGWAQLGQNTAGQDLTLVDAVAALRQQVTAIAEQQTQIINILKGAK